MILENELVIDNFAGGGGASSGIEAAIGRPVDVAINHDEDATAMHRINHPGALHLCQSVWRADPAEVVRMASARRGSTKPLPVGLAWFSPDCKHFSKAKGGKPVEKHIRDLAWVVVLWAQRVRPRIIMLENVEEFRDWGPLITTEDGKLMPCPARKGLEFRRWVKELKKLGYVVEHRELRACDYGAPTIRKRLFLVARCDGLPIVWPKPTHAKSGAGGLPPWRSAAECIDWSIACPSIFLTCEEGRAVGVNRPLADKTMARIAKGVQRYVIDAAEPFLVRVNHGDSRGRRAYGLDEPAMTVATSRSDALVSPVITYAQQGGANRDALDPAHTITASRKDQNALIAPYLVPRYQEKPGDDPRTRSVKDPAATIVAGGNVPGSLAAVYVGRDFGNSVGSDAEEPVGTTTAGGGGKSTLVAALMAQHNTGVIGRRVGAPLSTITATGAQQQLIAACLNHAYSSNTAGGEGDPAEPARTVTAGGQHHGLVQANLGDGPADRRDQVAAFMMKYYGTGGQHQDPRDPAHTIPTIDRLAAITVKGMPIVDIGMRMLTPAELFRMQGFRADYIIDRGLYELPDGTLEERPLTKTAQVRMCGNSVSPPPATALAAAVLGVTAIRATA